MTELKYKTFKELIKDTGCGRGSWTRKMLRDGWNARDAEIEQLKEEIKERGEVVDMQNAIINGMRRVLTVSRMVNNQRPDIRMTQALTAHDQCKLGGTVLNGDKDDN